MKRYRVTYPVSGRISLDVELPDDVPPGSLSTFGLLTYASARPRLHEQVAPLGPTPLAVVVAEDQAPLVHCRWCDHPIEPLDRVEDFWVRSDLEDHEDWEDAKRCWDQPSGYHEPSHEPSKENAPA